MLSNQKSVLLTTAFFVFIAGLLMAQVSLLPQHSLVIENTTLLRDSKDKNRWYYVPERPLLLERAPDDPNDPRPAFQFMTYQSEKDSKLYEGGVLQFSVSLKLPPKKLASIRKALKREKKYKYSDKLTLVPLPFRLAEAILYDAEGQSLMKVPQTPGLAPPYITGALPFQMKLNKFGADLYSALIDSRNSGVGVLMLLSFDGVLPAAGFKIKVNYDQSWKYFEKNDEVSAQVGAWLIGAKVNLEKLKIREKLIQNKCIEVESLSNEEVSEEMLDKYMAPVLERIGQELFAKIQAPEAIENAKAREPDLLDKCFFPVKTRIKTEMKDYKIVRRGSETIEFNAAVTVERKTTCGSFIGINDYEPEVKESLVSTMPLNNWASAFLMLPDVDNSPELNLVAVSMSAEVINKKQQAMATLSDTASWSAAKPQFWLNKDGDKAYSLKFPLMSLFDKHDNDIDAIRDEYSFRVNVQIQQKLRSFHSINISYTTPLFNGDLPLASPVDLVDNVVFDLSMLDFSSKEGLKSAIVELKSKAEKFTYMFSDRQPDIRSVVFIVPAAGEKEARLQASVLFSQKGGPRNIPWEHNNKDLRELEPSLYFLLFDSDWQSQP